MCHDHQKRSTKMIRRRGDDDEPDDGRGAADVISSEQQQHEHKRSRNHPKVMRDVFIYQLRTVAEPTVYRRRPLAGLRACSRSSRWVAANLEPGAIWTC